MWKDYSSGYIKNNRSSGLSVMIAAFISSLLLSLLCGLFYNAWKYEIERIEREKGGWQSQIVGELAVEDLETIKNFADVKNVVVNREGYRGAETTIDIYFDDMKSVFSDTPRIAKQVGIQTEKINYNYELLAMYLIRDSSDTAPRLLFPLFIVIMLAASFSLIIIIHNSFAVSMNARIMGLLHMTNVLLGSGTAGRHKAIFGYHPLVLVLTLLVTVITIWISVWLPARKLSRLTPLEAIKNTDELQLKCRKNSHLLTLLFGVEGELAGNALKAQRKALRTASLSLIFSFMAFAVMQCFFSLSEISTRETYFERYQGVWDVMINVKDANVDNFEEIKPVQNLTGVESAIVYQKAAAKKIVTEEEMSEEMKAFGGFSHASGDYVTKVSGGWLVNAPIVILDDNSFYAYCEQIGITPQLDGAVVLNQIRDVTNPDFRHPDFMPYVKVQSGGENAASILRQTGKEKKTAEVPVLSYTKETPALREEYATLDYYELVHFIPVSLWKEIKGQIGGAEEDSYICVRGRENVTLEELNMLQDEIDRLVGKEYTIESENRIQEYKTNSKQIQGMLALFGGFCVLLAVIGIGNVFSNTLGFVRQRKREFARYMSIGLTPKEFKKMFCLEALVIAGRPILISLPLVIIAVGYMLQTSYMEVKTFMAEAPLIPIIIFMLAIFGSVVLAYYLAWRNVRKISLAEVLRDDTMM